MKYLKGTLGNSISMDKVRTSDSQYHRGRVSPLYQLTWIRTEKSQKLCCPRFLIIPLKNILNWKKLDMSMRLARATMCARIEKCKQTFGLLCFVSFLPGLQAGIGNIQIGYLQVIRLFLKYLRCENEMTLDNRK